MLHLLRKQGIINANEPWEKGGDSLISGLRMILCRLELVVH